MVKVLLICPSPDLELPVLMEHSQGLHLRHSLAQGDGAVRADNLAHHPVLHGFSPSPPQVRPRVQDLELIFGNSGVKVHGRIYRTIILALELAASSGLILSGFGFRTILVNFLF